MHSWWLHQVIQIRVGSFKHQWWRPLDHSINLFMNTIIQWKINLCSHLVCHFCTIVRKMGEKKMELLIFVTLIKRSGRESWIWDEMWRSLIPSRQQAQGKNASVLEQDAGWFTFKLVQCSLCTLCTLQYNGKLLHPVYKFRLMAAVIQSAY